MTSLRDKQIGALKRMLNLNQSPETDDELQTQNKQGAQLGVVGPDGELIWKVLVFDDLGMQIVSSVLRVSDLRALGVTMHMHLAANRHKIEDVPVVYLVEPSSNNLKAITADLQKGLYSPAYINFLSSIPRPLLEEFAAETVANGNEEHIAQVYDQYLNFICADRDLFSLGMEKDHTYWALNSGQIQDEQLDDVLNKVVSGLFSVVVTMGVIPIIRCPKGMAAEIIATKLDRKLRDHLLSSKGNMFASGGRSGTSASTPASRPVLIILDRNIDLTSMLSHSWTYQSLVHDILGMHLNRVTIESVDEKNPGKGATKKTYDINATDFFWNKNAPLPFPQVAEDIDAELSKYKQESNEITRKTGVSSFEDLQNDNSASAQHLKTAITLLPELRERKAVLDIHMNILAALLPGIQSRQLDTYFQLEENIAKQTKAQILELLNDPDKGTNPTDKLRLFVIWYLTTEQEVSRTEWAQYVEALKAAGADITMLTYIKQVRATTKMTQFTTVHSTPQQQTAASTDLFGRFSSISSRLTDRLKDSGVPTNLSANLESIVGSIKNFLPANRDLTVTSIVGSIMDPGTSNSSAIQKTENYMYFDPRNSHARGTMPPPSMARGGGSGLGGDGGDGGSMPGGLGGGGAGGSFGQRRQGFTDAIVFVVGGGSIDEFGNLQEWVGRSGGGGDRAKRRVVYGATELMNAEQFCKEELERLGREVTS